MTTLPIGRIILGAGLLLMLHAGLAVSQMEDDLAAPSPQPYAEQEQRAVPGPGNLEPEKAVPHSPSVTPLPPETSALPFQQTLLSSKTVVGVTVNNAQGEKMGTVREIMLDPRSGQVVYAVVDSIGSFGLGKQKSFAVPWKALQVKLDQNDIVVQLDQGQFPLLPSVALNNR